VSEATKFKLQFPKQVLLTVICIGVFASYPLTRFAASEIIEATIAGVVLSIINVFMGYVAIEYSFGKSYTQFIQIVLGGIAFRLFVMSALLVVLIAVFKFHSFALVISLFGMYIIFLALEVVYIHNKWQAKIQN
jgi:hypothetical protein